MAWFKLGDVRVRIKVMYVNFLNGVIFVSVMLFGLKFRSPEQPFDMVAAVS